MQCREDRGRAIGEQRLYQAGVGVEEVDVAACGTQGVGHLPSGTQRDLTFVG
jgi:hypothetical protein